jgi:hypothetical protein
MHDFSLGHHLNHHRLRKYLGVAVLGVRHALKKGENKMWHRGRWYSSRDEIEVEGNEDLEGFLKSRRLLIEEQKGWKAENRRALVSDFSKFVDPDSPPVIRGRT